jgi:hypothetical protein
MLKEGPRAPKPRRGPSDFSRFGLRRAVFGTALMDQARCRSVASTVSTPKAGSLHGLSAR